MKAVPEELQGIMKPGSMTPSPNIPELYSQDLHPSFPISRDSRSMSYYESPTMLPSRQIDNVASQPPRPHSTQPLMFSSHQGRHGKTKFNLLNPMSLLARRRSSQAVLEMSNNERHTQQKILNAPGMRLPDDYDPRIRGKVVHDFSAPRPVRNFSANDAATFGTKSVKMQEPRENIQQRFSAYENRSLQDEDSPSSNEREHTPIFKEHFEDDVEPWHSEQGGPIGVTKVRSPAFMYQVSLTESDRDASSLPPFARNLPVDLSSVGNQVEEISPPSTAPLETVTEFPSPEGLIDQESARSSPPTSPPKTRSRAQSKTDTTFQTAGLPKHFKSNASRFSFDLAGVGSANQEKLLEDKHRQNAARKGRASVESGIFDGEEYREVDEEDYNYSDMDDDEGLEEKIPGINADAEEQSTSATQQAIEDFRFVSTTRSSIISPVSPMSTAFTSPDTPRDIQGQPIAFALSNTYPEPKNNRERPVSDNSSKSYKHSSDSCPVSMSADAAKSGPSVHSLLPETTPTLKILGSFKHQNYPEDDMYFDDGIIEDMDKEDGPAFDESVFDDDTSSLYGKPLRDLKPRTAVNSPPGMGDEPQVYKNYPLKQSEEDKSSSSMNQHQSGPNINTLAHERSSSETDQTVRPIFSQTAGLTQDNLAAYHDALAFAANQADLKGKFARQDSLESPLDEELLAVMVHHDGTKSQELNGFPSGDAEIFDFDDQLEDDPIIAAANAEALENDDEGFYGQEFGFFAHATGSEEAQYANGGYFGARGIEGVQRSHSGRVNFQEPSLTPITERSEWSHRNSMIALAMHGYPQATQTIPPTGLVQLADMIHIEDDNMSLSALMKLRRSAWNGSNASLQSSAGSQNSLSPLNYISPISPASVVNASSLAASSRYSLVSSNGIASDDDNSPSSPTITLQTQGLVMAPYMQAEKSSSSEGSSNVRRSVVGAAPAAKSHRRSSSGTESVSYVKEVGDEGRWVLEKRRLGEGGQVEVFGREIVEGGRI